MKEYLKLVRVRHYVKNLLVLFPCFFAGEMGNLGLLLKNLYAFITLCLSSSFIYIMNDIRDRERDKLHPVKKERPIASGRIPVRKAVATEVALFLGISGMLLLGGMGVAAIGCCCAYVFINLLYSFWGKDIPVIDVAFLGSGYLIRVLFGGYVSGIPVSSWLFLTVVCISFYLGLGKRYGELMQGREGSIGRENGRGATRLVLEKYTTPYLEGQMYLCLGLGIVFYSLWAIERMTALIYTVPVVILICMKYNLLVAHTDGDPVDTVYSSRSMMALIGMYMFLITGILYC